MKIMKNRKIETKRNHRNNKAKERNFRIREATMKNLRETIFFV